MLARGLLELGGWRIEGEVPDEPKLLLVGAPHTTNLDFVLTKLTGGALGVRLSWVGKQALFPGPLATIGRSLGGIPVDRASSEGFVDAMVAEFRRRERFYLALMPAGSRATPDRWRSGFYYIARDAGVPILLVAFDWGRRTMRLGPMLACTARRELRGRAGPDPRRLRRGARAPCRGVGRAAGTGASWGPSRGGYAQVAARAEELRDVLVTSRLFGDAAWEEEVLVDVVSELAEVVVRSGEVIVREGAPSDELFLVVGGRLRVVRASADGDELVEAEIGRGETVGELGLITGDRRSATVYAIRDSILARLTRDSYDVLCRRHPTAMMQRFAGGELRRLAQEAHGERRRSKGFRGAIALFAADGVALESFAGDLAQQLGRHGATLAVTAAGCDRVLDRAGGSAETLRPEDEAKLARWLAAQEQEHRFLLYQADLRPSAWAARCLRQSDHVVVLARAGAAPPGDGSAVGPLRRRGPPPDVARPPPRAGRDRAGRRHRVDRLGGCGRRVPRPGGIRRRRRAPRTSALRRGTALVVGGGGARSFAAAGVVRAVVEAGTPIDAVTGVSAGAIVAALVAMGVEYDELIARCTAVARRIDYTVPVYALTTGRNWSASLEELFGGTSIEDLLLPYSCTSVNLTAAELVVHERGSLLHAVRASTAIPGILPPVWNDGDLLVDGGLMNNLPIDLAHDRPGIGRVLAVDVTPPTGHQPREPFGYSVSGWRGLGARIARRPGPGLPTVTSLLMQSMLVSDARIKHASSGLADWIFHPPLAGHSLMEWDRIAAVADAGYRYASDALRDPVARAAVVDGTG